LLIKEWYISDFGKPSNATLFLPQELEIYKERHKLNGYFLLGGAH
jgi:hypothetical protein